MNNFEHISLILALLALFFAFIAIYQGRKSIRLQNKITKEQGIFDKPQLEIKLFEKEFVAEYYFAFPIEKYGICIAPLQISITNNGKSRANNIELYISASNDILPPDILQSESTVNSMINSETKKMRISKNRTTYGFKMDYLEQKNTGYFNFQIPLKNSTMNVKNYFVPNPKDKLPVKVNYTFSFSYLIKIWAHCENHPPIYEELNLSVVDISEISLRESFINESEEKKKYHNSELMKLSKLEKLKYHLNPNHKLRQKLINICYVSPNELEESEINKNIFFPKTVDIGYGARSNDGFILIAPLKIGYP